MSHLGRYAGCHFEFVRSIGLIPRHIPGGENIADMFTKTLTAKRLRWLIRRLFGLECSMTNANYTALAVRALNGRMRRPTVGQIFEHLADCENRSISEIGKSVIGSCFCRIVAEDDNDL